MARKENRINDDVRELCLDHGPKNPLNRTYKQNKFEAEVRSAWERLGEVLAALQRTVVAQTTRNGACAVNMAEGEARAAALKDLITNGSGARTLSSDIALGH